MSALVQQVEITSDREPTLAGLVAEVEGLTLDDAAVCPYLLIGTVEEIVEHVERCRARWGVTTFVVRLSNEAAIDVPGPVLAAFR
ncbi:MAG: hypothetical protein R2695_13925 [Acidimicrobiales bacterium]